MPLATECDNSLPARSPTAELRVSRASSVIVHRVPPDARDRFLEWQRGISAATTAFPGYQATDVYPPAEGQQQEWVVIIHFDSSEALERWLESPERAEWLAKLTGVLGDFQLKTMPAGFGAWFTGLLGPPKEALPPDWKIVLTVLLGLFPTAMLLLILVSRPFTLQLGAAADMLICNTLCVILLQWAVAPVVRIVLGPWLRACGSTGKTVTIQGTALIIVALVGLMFLFRLMTG